MPEGLTADRVQQMLALWDRLCPHRSGWVEAEGRDVVRDFFRFLDAFDGCPSDFDRPQNPRQLRQLVLALKAYHDEKFDVYLHVDCPLRGQLHWMPLQGNPHHKEYALADGIRVLYTRGIAGEGVSAWVS